MNKEKFLNDLAEILEEDEVKESDVLKDFDAWDSLSILSIIALGNDNYGKQLSNDDIRSLKTVGDLEKLLEA